MKIHDKILIISLLTYLTGCGGPKNAVEEKSDTARKTIAPSESMSRQAYVHFSNATILELLGDLPLASRQYAEALKFYPNSPEILYSYASTLFKLGRYRDALSKIEFLEPKDADTWLLMADSYRALGIHDSAQAAYLEVVKIDSNIVSAYNMLSAYYQQMEILDSVVWAYENVARLYPNYRVYQEIANSYLRLGEIQKAKSNYEFSIKMDSSDANVRSYLGLSVIYEEGGDRLRAKQFLEIAARLSPNNVLIQNRLLGFYQEDNELDKAITTANVVVAMAPLDRNAVRRLAILYFSADSLQKADSMFQSLLDGGDQNLVNYYYSGRIAFLGNDFPRAVQNFLRVTVLADSVVDGWLNLGLTYQEMDSVDLEIAAYENSLNYMKGIEDSLRMMFMLGSALERKRLYDKSMETFENILKLEPNHSQSLNYLGYMLAERGERLNYARELILRALKILPDNGAYLDSYGWVLYKLGDYEGALRELNRAIKFLNKDPVIFDHLGDAYKALGNLDSARVYWQKALEMDNDNQIIREKLKE